MEQASISANLIRGKVETMILRSLLDGEKFGLEILGFIKDASGGTYTMKKPTLYSALHRLEEKKYIKGHDVISESDGIKRRYYRLTEIGQGSFQDRKDDWKFSREVIDTLFYDEMTRTRFGKICDELDELDREKLARLEEYVENNLKRVEDVQGVLETAAVQVLEKFIEEKTHDDAAEIAVNDNIISQETVLEVVQKSTSIPISSQETTLEIVPKSVPLPPSSSAMSNSLGGMNGSGVSYVTQYFISGDYNIGKNSNDGDTNSKEAFTLPLTSGNNAVVPEEIRDYICAEKSQMEPYNQHRVIADEGIRRHDDGTLEVFFEKYISPNEYVVMQAQKEINIQYKQPDEIVEPEIKNIEYSPLLATIEPEKIEVAPPKKTGSFILYNRLKMFVAPIVACLVTISLVALMIATTYGSGEEVVFILSLVTAGIYLAVNFAVFMVFPRSRKLTGGYHKELLVRIGITAAIIISTVGIIFAVGATSVTFMDYWIFFTVGCILALAVTIEGLLIMGTKRLSYFRAD